eukprot:6204314-Pleurochrysis_carterae.AAC.3
MQESAERCTARERAWLTALTLLPAHHVACIFSVDALIQAQSMTAVAPALGPRTCSGAASFSLAPCVCCSTATQQLAAPARADCERGVACGVALGVALGVAFETESEGECHECQLSQPPMSIAMSTPAPPSEGLACARIGYVGGWVPRKGS